MMALLVTVEDCWQEIARGLRHQRDDLCDEVADLKCEIARLKAANERMQRDLDFERGRNE